jgi:lysophospholipase L1-like esterase
MVKGAHFYRRMVVPFTLAVLLLFAFVPAAFAISSNSDQSSWHGGLKQHYLALGDSLAFGYQPNGDFTHGYVNDLFKALHQEGVKDVTNYGCPGETSSTFINGGCPAGGPPPPYTQLAAAVAFLQANAGNVSPVTLDIGANDVLPDTDPGTCTVNVNQFNIDLATLDANLTRTILPALLGALTVNGRITGNIVMMNYYNPYQNICPNTTHYSKILNQHLATDVHGFGFIVNVFRAFGGAKTPNPNICTYTWMCAAPPLGPNIHPTNKGYRVIAQTFEDAIL